MAVFVGSEGMLVTKTIGAGDEPILPYGEGGDPDGVPILFLHGFGDSRHSFDLVLPRLPASIHAFVITQRGHGDAPRPESGYDIDDFAADALAFLDAAALPQAVLVGHSMGSAVARRVAAEHPERTLGLVLIGASLTTRGTDEARRFWETELKRLTDPIDESFARSLVEESVAGPIPADFSDVLVKEVCRVPAFVWRAAFEARWKAQDRGDELGRISTPTLVCWGELDPRYPRNEQEALVEAIPGARLITYPQAGHAPHWEQPDRFVSDLVAFVEALPGES